METKSNKSKLLHEIIKQLSWLTQLGLSLITPLLLCILVCVLLCNRFGFGGWIYIPGFILGLGASFTTGYNFYRSQSDKSKKDSMNAKKGFNRH